MTEPVDSPRPPDHLAVLRARLQAAARSALWEGTAIVDAIVDALVEAGWGPTRPFLHDHAPMGQDCPACEEWATEVRIAAAEMGWGPTAAHPDQNSGPTGPPPAAHLPSDTAALPVAAEALKEHADYFAALVDALLIESTPSPRLNDAAHKAVVAYRNLIGFYEQEVMGRG